MMLIRNRSFACKSKLISYIHSTMEKTMNKDLILREKLALQRTVLANQSTFLAFLRTSMYFLVAGLTINNVLRVQYGAVIKLLLFIIAALLFIGGIINYFYQQQRIKQSEQHIGDYKLDYEDSDS